MAKKRLLTTSKRIKVCHLVNYLGPAGKERGLLKLIAHMNEDIFHTTILVFNKVKTLGVLKLDRYHIIELDIPAGNNITLPLRLRSIFREQQFDIIHSHSWGTLVEGVLGAKLAGVPIVIHGEHGTFPMSWPHTLVQRLFWGRADYVLSVSEELRKTLAGKTGFPGKRITTILNGVEEDRFFPDRQLREQFRKKFGFRADDFIVGTVGRLYDVKNHPMLIRAVKSLTDRGLKVHGVIAGGSSDEKRNHDIREYANSLGLENHMHFLGFQSEINMILNGMDVFCLTSFSEGCSNVIQEAAFSAVAIIATNVGGNPELVEDGRTGFLVESDDHEGLADRIQQLYQDSELRCRLAQNARENGLKNFSLSGMVDQYERLYFDAYAKKFSRVQHSHIPRTVNG